MHFDEHPNFFYEVSDYPHADGTDAAHPAWWRGNDASVNSLCQIINELLDGKDSGSGVCNEPWQSTRRRLLELVKNNANDAGKDG